MTSRHRKERSHFDLQQGAASRNGARPASPQERGAASSTSGKAESGAHVTQGAQGGTLGKVEVSPKAIAHLASRAAQRSYGVVGLSPRNARPGWAELLRREEAYKGVDVSFPEGKVCIDLYVVIEYGTRISEVARNIMSGVKFAVESALGVSGVLVNVNVQDIRVSGEKT
jgi:uncharacterized alkaline shock family protein YloU